MIQSIHSTVPQSLPYGSQVLAMPSRIYLDLAPGLLITLVLLLLGSRVNDWIKCLEGSESLSCQTQIPITQTPTRQAVTDKPHHNIIIVYLVGLEASLELWQLVN